MKVRFPCFCSSHSVSNSDAQCKISNTGKQNLQDFRVFSYKELKFATENFQSSRKIGEGAFGSVFKGYLQDGTIVAVKVLSVELESLKGEREFISEITALSDIKHQNLVTLRGCCIRGANRYLVYDCMENNSLSQAFLREESRRFTWEMRRSIIVGIARGLAFLHEEAEPRIVHRDIKPGNILLDENFVPKIADFGLAKLFASSTTHVSTRVAGTLGYLAPEYAITGHLTRKSDVYSYGVLLLQIVTGRSVVEFNLDKGETYLVDEAWNKYKANNLQCLVDPMLKQESPKEEAVMFMKIGLLCVQKTANLRPKMSTVVKMLANEEITSDVSINKPGRIPDLSRMKVDQKHSSDSAFSGSSTSVSAISDHTSR